MCVYFENKVYECQARQVPFVFGQANNYVDEHETSKDRSERLLLAEHDLNREGGTAAAWVRCTFGVRHAQFRPENFNFGRTCRHDSSHLSPCMVWDVVMVWYVVFYIGSVSNRTLQHHLLLVGTWRPLCSGVSNKPAANTISRDVNQPIVLKIRKACHLKVLLSSSDQVIQRNPLLRVSTASTPRVYPDLSTLPC